MNTPEKRFAIKLPDGSWFNNEYRQRYTNKDKPSQMRLLTKEGCRMSLGEPITAEVKKHVAPELVAAYEEELKRTDREWGVRRDFWKQVHAFYKTLDSNAYWALLAQDGYELVEFNITPVGVEKTT